MIKLGQTIINPHTGGAGREIKAIQAHYYNTEDPARSDKSQLFQVGQIWSRGDDPGYQIDKLVLLLDGRKNTKLEAIMRKVDGPQLLNVNLITLINFWTLMDFNADYIIVNDNKRFEVIE